MSLNPHWFSTIYGVLFMVGQVLSALALMIVLLARLAEEEPLRGGGAQGHRARPRQADVRLHHALGLPAPLAVPHHLVGQPAGGDPLVPRSACTAAGSTWPGARALPLRGALPAAALARPEAQRAHAWPWWRRGCSLLRLVDLYWLVGPDLAGTRRRRPRAAPSTGSTWRRAVGIGGRWLWRSSRAAEGPPAAARWASPSSASCSSAPRRRGGALSMTAPRRAAREPRGHASSVEDIRADPGPQVPRGPAPSPAWSWPCCSWPSTGACAALRSASLQPPPPPHDVRGGPAAVPRPAAAGATRVRTCAAVSAPRRTSALSQLRLGGRGPGRRAHPDRRGHAAPGRARASRCRRPRRSAPARPRRRPALDP